MGDRYFRFAVRLAKSRWLVVAAAIWIQCSSGATYSFSIYSQTIKEKFNYDQKHLDTLASYKDLGANIGIVAGLIFDWFSPRGVLAIGAVQSCLAYLAMWLAVTGRVATPEFWKMCVYMFFGANAQTFFSTSCVVICVQNFPQNRGVVIGLMKGLLGLSGAIMTQLYLGVYGNQPSSYLLMVAWLPSVVTLFLMVIIRPVPAREERNESWNLAIVSTVALCLALFLMGAILVERLVNIGHSGYIFVLIVICGMLLLPLVVAVTSELQEAASISLPSVREPLVMKDEIDSSSPSSSVAVPTHGIVEGEGAQKSQQITSSNNAEASADFIPVTEVNRPQKDSVLGLKPAGTRPRRGEDHTITEAIGTIDFWLLSLTMACGMGGGLSAIDNTGQIGASLGYSAEAISTFISLFSIWNFLGRLGFGALSEFCFRKYQIGRPVLLAFSQALMFLGCLLISSALPGSLYPAIIVIGLCYGAQWSLMPAITSELFGLRRFATLFNTISIASPVGAYFFSVQVAGRLYDMEAAKDRQDHLSKEDLDCYGAHCFRLTFIIIAAASLFGCSVSTVLVHRTKSFYARVVRNSPTG